MKPNYSIDRHTSQASNLFYWFFLCLNINFNNISFVNIGLYGLNVLYLSKIYIMTTKKNNTNDFSNRTQSDIAYILISNFVPFKPKLVDSGRTFYVNDTTNKTVIGLQKAGFIVDIKNVNDTITTFRTY